jgi:L-lactate dehydrogenase (cytochrome)
MKVINSIGDLRDLARRRVPRAIFEYADRGSYDELTIRRNRAQLEALQIRQRVAVDLSQLSLGTTVLGEPWAIPVAIAPTGLAGLFHKDGEICGARAAQAFGVPFALSTVSICSIEDVAEATRKPFWFQLYLMKDRGFNAELIERAKAARCSALMLTLDLVIQGLRRRDARNGLSVPPRITPRNALEAMVRPGWVWGMATGKRRTFGNLAGRGQRSDDPQTLGQWIASQFDVSVTWKDIEWIRERWPGKLVVKGILDAEDARLACAQGVDALVVSNHGGRQLDGAPATIDVLPEVVDAVAGRAEVLFDGGILGGQDVFKALALGARGCLIGKAFLYGLAARGEAGVTQALQILRDELRVTMALAGRVRATDIDRSVLRNPPAITSGR